MKVLFKILNFKTMMFFLVLGISIFLYKYLVSTRPEAKPLTIEEKTFYVNVISPKRNNYSPTSDANGKILSSGKHEELLQNSKQYKNFYDKQIRKE